MALPRHTSSDLRHAARDQRLARFFVLSLAVYFILQVVLRLCLSQSLDLDEAEQAYIFQHLQAGYETQPPLYAWLQWLSFHIFGVNLFALSVLKNLFLFTTYACLFALARPMIGISGAVAASASLILLPAIGWESQRDLTHSVLLTTAASVTLYGYFLLLRKPDRLHYALFGLMVALGMLSKYNFALFVGGILIASLLVPEHRAIVWNRKVLIAVGVALVCLLPHIWWLSQHFGAATGGTLHKMSEGESADYLSNILEGGGSLLLAILSFITPLWIIYGWLCRRHFKRAKMDRDNPNARFFLWLYAAFFVMLAAIVLGGHLTYVKNRWMLPLLFSVPLMYFLVWPGLGDRVVFRRILRIALLFAVIILLALPLRIFIGPLFGKTVRAHFPFPELSQQLATRFPQVDTLIVDAKLTAGNLYFQRPALNVILLNEVLNSSALQDDPLSGDVLLISGGNDASADLAKLQQRYPDSIVQQQGHLDLPMDYVSDQTMPFNFVYLVIRKP